MLQKMIVQEQMFLATIRMLDTVPSFFWLVFVYFFVFVLVFGTARLPLGCTTMRVNVAAVTLPNKHEKINGLARRGLEGQKDEY